MRKNGNGAPVFTGPGGTEYNLIGCGPLGRVGAARLSQTKFRVRVEPGVTSIDEVRRGLGPGWNQPEGTNVRFSIVVRSESEADSAIETALKASTALPEESAGA